MKPVRFVAVVIASGYVADEPEVIACIFLTSIALTASAFGAEVETPIVLTTAGARRQTN